jgi:hypothetical protein
MHRAFLVIMATYAVLNWQLPTSFGRQLRFACRHLPAREAQLRANRLESPAHKH